MTTNDIDKVITQSAMISFATCYGHDEASAVYVSTPITTGRNYLEWLRLGNKGADNDADSYPVSREVFVTAKNIDQAAKLVRRVRAKYTNPVIDPTGLQDIDSWNQNDYHQFWIKVIRQLVSIIIFADGWEYSNGSTLEYVCGLEKGLGLLSHHYQPLTPLIALAKLKSAVADYGEQNVKSKILDDAVDFLENFVKEERVASE